MSDTKVTKDNIEIFKKGFYAGRKDVLQKLLNIIEKDVEEADRQYEWYYKDEGFRSENEIEWRMISKERNKYL